MRKKTFRFEFRFDEDIKKHLKEQKNMTEYLSKLIRKDINSDVVFDQEDEIKKLKYTVNAMYTLMQIAMCILTSTPYWKDVRYINAKASIDESKRQNKDKMKGNK